MKITQQKIAQEDFRRVLWVAFCVIIILLIAYGSGQWHPNMDGRITEMYICDSNTTLSHATEFISTTNQLYICGIVEGTNLTRASFFLWCNDVNIFTLRRSLNIGHFFIPIPNTGYNDSYSQGNCRSTVQYDRIVVHEVNFSIVKP